ncbi:interleukin-10 receptor subunit alpha [Salminus brasiliensis]|uniref:interleukin-10 receptor subunit alpha n=1 Tax=Salminus brasiliensis TaxID=930266 RepID=UPI003B8360C1
MDRNPWVLALVMLFNLMLHISGVMMKPQNVTVHLWEGNVTVTWDPPQKNPRGCLYTVQVSNYMVNPWVWENVTKCNLLHDTVCNIGTLINESEERVVRVVVHTSQGTFYSSNRKFNIKRSKLLPPSFTLLSTTFSVQVKIHRKQLSGIFPYGLDYTAYLWPEGQNNQTQSGSDTDEDGDIRFSSLQPWQVYCVRVQVKSESGARNMSSVQCIQLPIDMALIIYFVFLGLLGFVTVLMIFVCCFLRRPIKMPDSLKPVVNKWQPMTIGLDKVETVTDKGWILFTNKNEEKRQTSEEKIDLTEEDKDWRESLDSGVSMEKLQPSANNTEADEQTRDIQEDSGCGSLKGTEGSGSGRRATEELLSLDEISHDSRNERREDSGLGMGHREVSSSLEGEDSGLLSEVVIGDGYRSQSPSSVDVKNETSEPCDMDTNMAAPLDGYRSGQVTCMCLDHEYCVWCKFKKPLTEDRQSVTQVQTDLGQIVDGDSAISNYRKNLIQTVNLLSMEESVSQSMFPQSDMSTETSPFLFPCPLLLHNGENQACITDANSFTLEDVKLTFF